MYYPAAIHKDPESDYGISFPDLPGCISAASTLDELMLMGREAAELWLEDAVECGEMPPEPTPLDALRDDPDWADATWAVISVDVRVDVSQRAA